MTRPSSGHDPCVCRRTLGNEPVPIDEPRLAGIRFARRLLRQHVWQQRHRLDVDPGPARFRHRDNGNTGRCLAFAARRIETARLTTQAGRRSGGGNA